MEKMLDGMLSELRLNYVDEKSKAPEKVEAKKEKEKPKAVKKKPKKKKPKKK
jgi:hypothetical protein